MLIRIGEVEALFRYPVKSMRGESLDEAGLGWHGLDGDRRFAFRRIEDRSGFPWLTAGKLPDLLLFGATGNLPTHVRTPEGKDLPLFSEELAADVGRRHGAPVEMMYLNRGIFDEASVSLITSTTVGEIGKLAATPPDARRFRPNILISSARPVPFEEDGWVNGILTFGEGSDAAAIGVTNYDERCGMVNYDPDSARPSAEMLKVIVRERNNYAGVYGATIRRGRVAVGQPIFFAPA